MSGNIFPDIHLPADMVRHHKGAYPFLEWLDVI
jgi:hypothetical protein